MLDSMVNSVDRPQERSEEECVEVLDVDKLLQSFTTGRLL